MGDIYQNLWKHKIVIEKEKQMSIRGHDLTSIEKEKPYVKLRLDIASAIFPFPTTYMILTHSTSA